LILDNASIICAGRPIIANTTVVALELRLRLTSPDFEYHEVAQVSRHLVMLILFEMGIVTALGAVEILFSRCGFPRRMSYC
jgi:hypothetical protein